MIAYSKMDGMKFEEFFEKNLEFARNWDLLRCVWSQKRRKYIKKWDTNHKKNKGTHKNINEIYGESHFTLVNLSKIKKNLQIHLKQLCPSD